MLEKKIERAAGLAAGLMAEAYSSAESLSEIKGTLNKIQDDYILVPRKDAEALRGLLKTLVKNDGDDPRLAGRDSPHLPLLEALEEAFLAH